MVKKLKIDIRTPEQAWFLLTVAGRDTVASLQALSPADRAYAARLLNFIVERETPSKPAATPAPDAPAGGEPAAP